MDTSKWKQKQTALTRMLNDGANIAQDLDMTQHFAGLNSLEKKVKTETFKVMVVGLFKAGKSTFINSFLGEEILPAYATPCTAVINEIKYQENKQAVLFFKNPLPERLPSGISGTVLKHIKKHSEKIPPIVIPCDEIEEYAVIPMGKDPKESLLESPYDKIELYWPLELLRNGVEIIDSPGLNENETRTKVTMEYLANADAVLFLLTSLATCSKTEMDFIENNLHKSGFDDIFYIFNRFDQVQPKEKDRVRNYGIERLKTETSFGERGIFFVSAYEALMGKLNKNIEQFQKSGVASFEKVLADFLINQRGKVKLSQPAKELKRIINEALFTTIPQQKSMLRSSLAEIETKYAEAKPKLENLEVKKRQMSERINYSIERMLPDIRRCVQGFFRDLIEKIPVWLEEIDPENEFQTFHPQESSERIITELLEKMQSKIEVYQLDWQQNTLVPLVTDQVQEIMYSIEGNVENFFVELDNIKVNIAGHHGQKIEGARDISAFERIGAAALGFFAGDIGSAAIGSSFGFSKTFFKQLAMQIGAIVGMIILGMTNPLTMLPVIIGIAVFGFFRGKHGIINELKGKVASGTIEEINKLSSNSVEEIIDGVKYKVKEIGDGIINALENEIQAVRNQVESIIRELKAGEVQVEKKRQKLGRCENGLIKINQDLDDFILAL